MSPPGPSQCALASGAAPASCRPTRGLPWPARPRHALQIRAPAATPFSRASPLARDCRPSSTSSSS
eukprot:3803976-Rhodomonas_salina.1